MAPLGSEVLEDYDRLCRQAHEAPICMQCGVDTEECEGLLCSPCVLEDGDARDEHEWSHGPGRV